MKNFRSHNAVISKSFLNNFFMPRPNLYTRDRGENTTGAPCSWILQSRQRSQTTQRNSKLMLASDGYMQMIKQTNMGALVRGKGGCLSEEVTFELKPE